MTLLLACVATDATPHSWECLKHTSWEWLDPACPCADRAVRLTAGGMTLYSCRPDQSAEVTSDEDGFLLLCRCEGDDA